MVEVTCGSLANGQEFQNNFAPKPTFRLVLGQNSVIAGWEQGFPGMMVGGRRLEEDKRDGRQDQRHVVGVPLAAIEIAELAREADGEQEAETCGQLTVHAEEQAGRDRRAGARDAGDQRERLREADDDRVAARDALDDAIAARDLLGDQQQQPERDQRAADEVQAARPGLDLV